MVSPPGRRDGPSVDASGRPLTEIEGVRVELLTPHADHRGSLLEIMDPTKPFWDEPVVYAYRFTIKPGRIKGWGMHKRQADRYFVCSGELRVVLFDGREDSPSHGRLTQFSFADRVSGLVRIPPGVWHADQNIGDQEAIVINFPTRAFDRNDPDKYRIDPHSGEIAFDWTLRDG
jgi:dTDP-4-dehydrorhamnose 3,5-epimerase